MGGSFKAGGEDMWVVRIFGWQFGGREVRILRRRGYLGGSFRAEGEDIWGSVLGLPLNRVAETAYSRVAETIYPGSRNCIYPRVAETIYSWVAETIRFAPSSMGL